MVDRPLNEQHEWGGRLYRPTSTSTGGQTFLPSRPAADTDPTQAHFTASVSDDLFAPATAGHSVFDPYILPTVPDCYNHRRNELPTPTLPSHDNVPFRDLSCFPPSYNKTPLHHNARIHSAVPHPLPDVNHPLPIPHVPLRSLPRWSRLGVRCAVPRITKILCDADK